MVVAIMALVVVLHGSTPAPELLPDKRLTGYVVAYGAEADHDAVKQASSAPAPPVPATTPPPVTSSTSSGTDWDALVACESNSDPAKGPTGWATTTTGNGYYFAIQAAPGTWLAYGGTQAELDQADAGGPAPSRARLIDVAEAILAGQGPGAWPNCYPG